jgi:diguanylate cyclase (GGDEF)-like protein
VAIDARPEGGRRSSGGSDLQKVLAMSSELARTLDVRERAKVIARHLAVAVGVDECAISYWDRAGDRVVTYGYHPPERTAEIEPEYALADYPETRRVLTDQVLVVVDVGDESADSHEVDYLRSIDARTSAMLPLLSRGESIGLVELTARRRVRFDPARLDLARSMANEAAMALETARLYEQIEHQAMHDNLTGLPNRALFIDRLGHALARTRRSGSLVAVLFVDLDHFKHINDGLGHAAGDRVLAFVGSRLRDTLRPGDTVARLGGDEFGVLLDPIGSIAEAGQVADRLLESLQTPVSLGSIEYSVKASIGLAVGKGGGAAAGAEQLLADADVAMYSAKQRGKGRWEPFRASLRDAARQRAQVASSLSRALQNDEFVVHYQPIFQLSSGRIQGVEALLRWQHPQRGLVRPTEFIAIAEETGLIVQLGGWVLRTSCAQAAAWQRLLDRPDLALHVNLSPRQFEHPAVVHDVEAALAASGLPAESLTLEITESLLVNDAPTVVHRMKELKRLGVRLAIDDFGTGYSSLNYLQRLPIDSLKIDKTFVDGLGTGDASHGLVQAILHIASSLGLQAVAEGVERADQQPVLTALSCDLAQGYALARPHQPAEIEALLVAMPREEAAAV